MLSIEIDGQALDLEPGTKLEMERANPFLQFDERLPGDYSLPLDLRLSPKNMKLLRFAGLIQTRVDPKGIPATVNDHQNQHSVGRLKIESPKHNLNRVNAGMVSVYYVTGASDFFQDVKSVNLRDIDMGGVRSFAWDNYNTAGGGFWQHIHDVINAGVNAYDYAFFPVINKAWAGSDGYNTYSTEMMNRMKYSGGQVLFEKMTNDDKELNVIVPFPYLKKVVQQAAALVGWKVQGPALDDPDFITATMINFQAIDWGFMSPYDQARWIVLGPTSTPGTHPADVKFDLADHLPDITISDFFLSLKNRFGWWYDFNSKTKTITITDLQASISTADKDYTHKSSVLVPKKVAQTPKVWGIKNEFVGDYANGAPELANVTYMGTLNHKSLLPAADKSQYGQVWLILDENNFYICRPQNAVTTDLYEWQFYAYNVYDIVPDGATDFITTKATALGSEPYDTYLDLVPRMDLPGNWNRLSFADTSWHIHLVFYKGMKNNKAGQPFPFATSGIYDSNGNQVAQWSLAFTCLRYDGQDVGLWPRKWKTTMQTIQAPETFEFVLQLDRAEMEQLKFSDTIIISGVKMYLTKIKPVVPYAGELPVESIRI
jgi:hypothetical protein